MSCANATIWTFKDLLFCPDFTVHSARPSGTSPDGPDEITDSCELIWEAGVGCAASPPRSARHDHNRTEVGRRFFDRFLFAPLPLTCYSLRLLLLIPLRLLPLIPLRLLLLISFAFYFFSPWPLTSYSPSSVSFYCASSSPLLPLHARLSVRRQSSSKEYSFHRSSSCCSRCSPTQCTIPPTTNHREFKVLTPENSCCRQSVVQLNLLKTCYSRLLQKPLVGPVYVGGKPARVAAVHVASQHGVRLRSIFFAGAVEPSDLRKSPRTPCGNLSPAVNW